MSNGQSDLNVTTMPPPVADELLETMAFLRASLDHVQANVLIADTEFIIVYANEKSLATFKTIEVEIEQAFGVSIDEILGGTIHRFHKDSHRVEEILRNPAALPHETQFTFEICFI